MPEEEAFAVLVKLMQEYRLRELFKPSMAELGLCMYKLECLIQVGQFFARLFIHIIVEFKRDLNFIFQIFIEDMSLNIMNSTYYPTYCYFKFCELQCRNLLIMSVF